MPITKAELSQERRHLIGIMQQVNFGRIHQLQVRNGEPAFTPMTRVERHIKFGGENRPRPEAGLDDFALKRNVIELFDNLDRLGDGNIKQLEINGGLPFDMTVEERLA